MTAILEDPVLLSDLIGLVYDSALEEPQWQRLLDRLTEVQPEICVAIAGYDGAIGTPTYVQSGFDPAYVQKYVTEYALKNDTAAYQMTQPVGSVFGDDDLIPRADYLRFVFLREWLAPQGLGPASGAILASNNGRFLAVNAAFPFENEVETRGKLHTILRVLVPHIIRAMEIARTLKLSEAMARDLRGLFDAVIVPMVVTDFSGQYLFANAAGTRMIERGAPLGLAPSGRVRLATTSETDALHRKIADVRSDICVDGLQIGTDASDTMAICIAPFRPQMSTEQALDDALFGSDERVALFIGQRKDDTVCPALLQDVFALSKREADVCRALITGRTPAEIAEQASRSEKTVRNQIQTIYGKVGVNHQAELIDALSIFKTVGTMFDGAAA